MTNPQIVARLVSLLAAFVVLFGLQMAFQAAIYVAIPAGIAAYTVSRLGFALLTPQDSKTRS